MKTLSTFLNISPVNTELSSPEPFQARIIIALRNDTASACHEIIKDSGKVQKSKEHIPVTTE